MGDIDCQFIYITREAVPSLDYFSFIRLPYRKRKFFWDVAKKYQENIKKSFKDL